MKGKKIFILYIDWVNDFAVISKEAEAFESKDEAEKKFNELGEYIKTCNPYWEHEETETSIEYWKDGYYADSHAAVKIIETEIK